MTYMELKAPHGAHLDYSLKKQSHASRVYFQIGKAIIIFLAVCGVFSLTRMISLSAHEIQASKHCFCGDSITEALALECKFDSLAAAWLPPHCRDEELTAEFARSGTGPNGSWPYFADSQHTIPLSLSDVAALADNQSAKAYMTYEWHVAHCLFYWRKMFRVGLRGVEGEILEPSFDNEHHIIHCMKVIMRGTNGIGPQGGILLDS